MTLLNNSRFIVKIAVPLGLMIVLALGLVVYARSSLDHLAGQTRTLIDGEAARQRLVLRAALGVAEATIQEKNIIIETSLEGMIGFRNRQERQKRLTLADLDTLITLAADPAQAATERELRRIVETYFAVMDRSTALGLANDLAAATKMTQGETATVRGAVREAFDKRIKASIADLDLAKSGAAASAAQAATTLLTMALAGLLVASGLAVTIVVSAVTRPLGRITTAMGKLADGDLAVPVAGTERRDEVGALARALAVFRDNAVEARRLSALSADEGEAKMRRAERLDRITRAFEAEAVGLTGGLASAATEMEATAHAMTGIADTTRENATAVAVAADQTSCNVQTVAAATEELAISIQEITRQVATSAEIAGNAVAGAQATDRTIRDLATAAERIGNVVAMISGIAAQTNLLALNATIEAARAGEAGRGFAVVASEVKELAGQTSRATAEIAGQIEAIQDATRGAVAAVQGIGEQITGLADIANQVAAAMEEQGAATQEIARNVQQAARGTEHVAGTIGEMSEGAGRTGSAATRVLDAARGLAVHSDSLGRTVEGFLADVKAA